jgi:chromosome segregation ATPase
MKKTHLYFLVPLVGLLIFGAIYWNFDAGYEQSLADKAAAEKAARLERLHEEDLMRVKAVDQANALAAKRTQERKDKEARQARERQEISDAQDAARKAGDEKRLERDKVESLKKDVVSIKADIERIEIEKADLQARLTGFPDVIAQAQENTQSLKAVLDKIAAADAAIEAAAKAAALAAAKKSS